MIVDGIRGRKSNTGEVAKRQSRSGEQVDRSMKRNGPSRESHLVFGVSLP